MQCVSCHQEMTQMNQIELKYYCFYQYKCTLCQATGSTILDSDGTLTNFKWRAGTGDESIKTIRYAKET